MSEQEIEPGPEIEPAPVVAEVDPETTAEARKYGWKDQGEFSLAPEGWVDAARFMELPSTQRKVANDRARKFEADNASLRDQMSRIAALTEAQVAKTQRDERARYDAELARIKAEKRDALETADTARFDRLEAQEERLREAQPAQQTQRPQVHPEVAAYEASDAGKWLKDPEMARFAARVVEETPGATGLSPARQIALAERRVREMFPERFPSAPAKHAKVDGGGLATRSRTKGAADLPADARAAGKDFVAKGWFKDMEAYAKAYYEQESTG